MSDTAVEPAYTEAIALLQKALALCDDAGVGLTATPHLDLALNLLVGEYQASRARTPSPAQG